jgi:hypothetical protein
MLFNSPIGPTNADQTNGWPGIYNGDASSANYNPLGWYSYKVVIKQTEQEYYNVYLPGIMAAYPEDDALELGSTSHTVLINDNINKVPRDLSEVGPEQKQFRSSVRLFGRIENTATTITTVNFGLSNKQYYPSLVSDTASMISTLRDMFDFDTSSTPAGIKQLYDYESNPLISRISTVAQIGQKENHNSGATPPGIQYLAVYETEPVDSQIDIYWETSTSGLISSLNEAILQGTSGGSSLSNFNTSNWSESLASAGNILNTGFNLLDVNGQTITISGNNSFDLMSVIDGTGQDVQLSTNGGPYFELYITGGVYQIRTTTAYFNNVYYSTNSDLREFTFNFRAVIFDSQTPPVPTTTLFSEFAAPSNVAPTITSSVPAAGNIFTNSTEPTFAVLKGVNGAANTALRTKSLTYSITKQEDSNQNSVNFFGVGGLSVVGTEYQMNLANLSNNANPIPMSDYTVHVTLSDPIDSVTNIYTLKIGTVPAAVNDIVLTTSGSLINGILIRVNQTSNPNNGYYILAGYTFAQWQNNSVGSITQPFLIDRKNAKTVTQGSCVNLTWYYAATESAVKTLWKDSCGGLGLPGGPAVSNFTDFYYQVLEV